MKNKILTLSMLGLIFGSLLILPKVANAYQGDPTVQGPYYSQERHLEMTKAFENKDYNAWKNLMNGKGRVTQVVNKDNFTKFVQAHLLALQGKTDEANKIKAELGLGLKNGGGSRNGSGNRFNNK